MSVDIEPFELNFRRPFTQEVSETLTLRNPNATPVAFKVKTTAPKQYCVRPNAGRIEPGQEFDVTVLLQAFKQEPPLDTRCRDKFLVQSAPITSDKEFSSIPGVLESTEKALLQERKIRVNWLAVSPELDQSASRPSVSTPSKQSLANGPVDTPELSRTYSSPSASEEPAPPSSLPPPYVPEDPKPEPEKVEEKPEVKPEVKRSIVQATTAAGTVAQAAYDEIKAKLAQAEAQVAALTLKESTLRQRNTKPAEIEKRPNLETVQAVRQTVEGVPVQSVAILCLISFLLAYLFF